MKRRLVAASFVALMSAMVVCATLYALDAVELLDRSGGDIIRVSFKLHDAGDWRDPRWCQNVRSWWALTADDVVVVRHNHEYEIPPFN